MGGGCQRLEVVFLLARRPAGRPSQRLFCSACCLSLTPTPPPYRTVPAEPPPLLPSLLRLRVTRSMNDEMMRLETEKKRDERKEKSFTPKAS